ncbi:hypothetical protein [Coraliomargarita parva]|uniref:hypothetical protein n=1 Tax=Coraliomargarita parva TaxID=3014050 RepID=UPI0022B3A5AC|nr:hypothetical protein [Coraliomargarita parva]
MGRQYQIEENRRMQYAGIYLLEYVINQKKHFPVFLQDDEEDLEPVLEWLLTRDCLKIVNNDYYEASAKGRETLERFNKRYREYLTCYDVFCAVDLEAGEFAFSNAGEFDNEEQWQAFLENERWEDLRIAIAQHLNANAVEIVFMSFINEKRFGRNETGWQFDLLLGSVWDTILNICANALHVEDLSYEDEGETISGGEVIEDIYEQGLTVMEQIGVSKHLRDNQWNSGADDAVDYSKFRDPDFQSKLSKDDWAI